MRKDHPGSGIAVLLLALLVAAAPPSRAAPADVAAAALNHDATSTDPGRAGIWKAAVPPAGSMHGEFDSNDPIGVMAGARIWADCSINWTDPDSQRLYCFSSATSLVFFLEAPQDYLRRAAKQWRELERPVS
jgi:hypothetical protein